MRLIAAVLRRPSLWGTAIVQAFRLARPRWWARPPFLPLPAVDYVAMRATIQYGDPKHSLEAEDLLKYLMWCKAENRRLAVGRR